MDILSLLNWRYAAKRMTGQKIPQEKVEVILESIRLSASSIGLQPYRVIVIEDPSLLAQIKPVANNQAQITEASHLLVFAAWTDITETSIEEYLNLIAQERNVSIESLAPMRAYFQGLKNNTPEQNFNWAARQAYIALGTGLIAAASQEVDATPMEGFDSAALDQILNLPEKGLQSVSIMALGYRDVNQDWLVGQPKVRTPKSKFFLSL
ncbi:NAD(P)H-dependent oxidoreductase [Paradesertivirga mongoliensis]|uniref:NAD(P)H-dependent oxidoreductase n=1 Tax=Paradesertivirga mongoliensis TaxID=2100740 RepID=A0ABW4ZPG0_9SPHI|nr:NAD(P)H-dependent oxidoreductase [Pedobacter mongoliensis]